MSDIEEQELKGIRQILDTTAFKPVSKLSYGSYGQIYKIETSPGKYLVLKVVSKTRMAKEKKLHEAVIEGFILSQLSHPGIIGYQKTLQNKQYISQMLEYCPFGDLAEVMKKVNKNIQLALKKRQIALFYLSQVIEAVSYLHSKEIMHRDLKLENVVLDQNLNAKLVDFGTAKPCSPSKFYSEKQLAFIEKLRKGFKDGDEQDQIKRTKSFVGSASYLSPQSINMNHSFATDIWAFGVMAYKIFHDRLPFEGENNYEIFKKIKEYNIAINDKLDEEIQDLIKVCLKLDPQDRPTVNQIKGHPYFKGVNFEEVFSTKSPINPTLLVATQTKKPLEEKDLTMELVLEKKMFFGNYKTRVLKVYDRADSLYMSYWYLDGKAPKNQFQLSMTDCAQTISKTEFEVRNGDIKYGFRVLKEQTADRVVNKINSIIKKHFKLQ